MCANYLIFFYLRNKYKKYPIRCAILADLMGILFQHNDIFPNVDYVYLKDSYPEEDIRIIFEELGLPFSKLLSSQRTRSTNIIRLKDVLEEQKEKP